MLAAEVLPETAFTGCVGASVVVAVAVVVVICCVVCVRVILLFVSRCVACCCVRTSELLVLELSAGMVNVGCVAVASPPCRLADDVAAVAELAVLMLVVSCLRFRFLRLFAFRCCFRYCCCRR